jgi:hypothetical protein
LLIDGAYLQIGVKEINQTMNTNFRMDKESKLKKLVAFFEVLVDHPLDKIVFVSSEDFAGMIKNEPVYVKLKKIGVILDIREYKFKSTNCSNCKV